MVDLLYYIKNISDALQGICKKIPGVDPDTPVVADNIKSWENRGELAVTESFADAVRTTAGDTSIISASGSSLVSIVARKDFYASALISTGFNLLRNAVAVGDGWYFLVPALPFGSFATATKPNGILFTNSNGENVKPTVRFKALSAGVPTSISDGDACAYTDSNGYRFYNPSAVGYLIVSGINRPGVCAHVGWSGRHDEYKPIDDTGDAGSSITLSTIIHAIHSYDQMLAIGAVADRIDFGDTAATWTRRLDRVKPTWANIAGEEGAYTHVATIEGMKAGGAVECGNIVFSVNGNVISYTDTTATGTTDWVKYELDTPVTGNVTVSPKMACEDWGLEMLADIVGEAYVVIRYARGYPDSVAALVAGVFDDVCLVLAVALASIDNRISSIEDRIETGFTKIITDDLEVRNAIDDFSTKGNANASGAGAPDFIPAKIGQAYFDTTNKVWYEATAFSVEGWKIRTNS